MNLVALGVAALSAVGFAVSTSLQHHANTHLGHRLSSGGTARALLQQPRWLVGQVLALASFSLHALALQLGLLMLVQPVVVSGIVLAVPVRAAMARRLPGWSELGTVAVTAAGLSLFLVSAHPRAPHDATTSIAFALTAGGVVLAFLVSRWADRRHRVARASGYGLAAGVLFGLTAGLVKLTAADVARASGLVGHLTALVTAWPAWAVVLVGLSGVALNQRAYRAAPLSASMPLLNTVDVLVAIAFGVLVFGEVPALQPLALVGQGAALVLMTIGLTRLGRQHALEALEPIDAPVPTGV